MKRLMLALEEGSLDDAPVFGLGSTTATLIESDQQSRSAVASLANDQQALVALEAMGNALKSQNPTQIGRFGVLFANIAIEQHCSSNKISMEDLAIDVVKYDKDPEGAVSEGTTSIDNAKKELSDRIHASLTELLGILNKRRDGLNRRIGDFWKIITHIEMVIAQNEGGVAAEGPIAAWEGCEALVYHNKGYCRDGSALPAIFDENAARIVNDISHFLTEHSHLFKRIIAKQINWINDHKDNLLKGKDGFAQYVFNPVEYRCNGAMRKDFNRESAVEFDAAENEQVFQSIELPGMMAFATLSTAETMEGIEGIEALAKSKSWIEPFNATKRVRELDLLFDKGRAAPTLQRLDLENCKARIAEMKRALRDYEHWADIACCKLWKDAYFEQEVLAALLKVNADSLTERAVMSMAQAVVAQLAEASQNVPEYVENVFTHLLTYIAASLNISIEYAA